MAPTSTGSSESSERTGCCSSTRTWRVRDRSMIDPGPLREALRSLRLDWLSWLRRSYFGNPPHYVVYDTGAEIYQWCKYRQNMLFGGVDMPLMGGEIAHFHGV